MLCVGEVAAGTAQQQGQPSSTSGMELSPLGAGGRGAGAVVKGIIVNSAVFSREAI